MARTFLFLLLCLTLATSSQSQPAGSGPIKINKDKAVTLSPAVFPKDCPVSGSVQGPTPNVIPQTETRTVAGVSFIIKTARFVQNNQVCLTTDLFDLQNNIGAIIATKNVPTNNCASYVMPNPVVTIQTASLAPSSSSETLKFTMGGYVTPWACGPGLPISHSEWVPFSPGSLKPFHPPTPGHYNVWTTPGPDTKVPGGSVSFTEEISYTLKPYQTKVKAWANADAQIPYFSPQVPEINMTVLVNDALNAALPTFPHAQAPLVNVQGQRYINNRSQIWGTF